MDRRDPVRPDHRRVAKRFDHLARRTREGTLLDGRALEGLAEHLTPIKLSPSIVLDLGSGEGAATDLLSERFPKARLIGLDLSYGMLSIGRSRAPRWFSRRRFVQGSAIELPLADASVDVAIAHLVMPWIDDLHVALREMRRVTRPGGFVLVSSYGSQTLGELNEQLARTAPEHPAFLLPDMHELGDAMMSAGYRDVVMDADRLTIRYADASVLRRDLRSLGAMPVSNSLAAGSKLKMPVREEGSDTGSPVGPRSDPELEFTVELIYGHGWVSAGRSVGVPVPVPFPKSSR